MKFDKIFFQENGYLIIENVFQKKDCDYLVKTANNFVVNNDYTPLMNKHNNSNEIFEFIANKQLKLIIEEYFIGKALGLQTEFFFMPPGTQGFSAHQDNTFVQAKGPTFISAWIALTDITPENGGLIIWPKSHMEKQLKFEETMEKKIVDQDPNANKRRSIIPKKYKKFSPCIKKGDVILIDKWLVHASHANLTKKSRYVLLCTYIRENAYYRKGNYANREAFKLDEKNR